MRRCVPSIPTWPPLLSRESSPAASHTHRAFSTLTSGGGGQRLTIASLFSSTQRDASRTRIVGDSEGAVCAGAALQLQLPPLWTWCESRAAETLCAGLDAYALPLLTLADGPHQPRAMFLRLFPDATVARLSRPTRGKDASQTHGAVRKKRQKRVPPPPHQMPLDAFVEAEDPWGAGVDPVGVLRSGFVNLQHVCSHFSSVPLVLILPTRMLVTQDACHRLFDAIAQRAADGHVMGVVFELPPNQALYDGEGTDKNGLPSWVHLSLLSTPWDSLLRSDSRRGSVADVLRHRLTRNTLMPLHVLLPWVMQQRMLAGVEVGFAADTILPESAHARRRATVEGPDFFLLGHSCSGGGLRPHGGFRAYMSAGAQRGGGVDSPMTQLPCTAAVEAAVRMKGRVARDGTSGSPAATVNLDAVTEAMRQQRPARTDAGSTVDSDGSHASGVGRSSLAPQAGGNDGDAGAGGLLLDAPPESLRRLIMESVVPDPVDVKSRQDALYAQVGRLVAGTFAADDGDTAAAAGSAAGDAGGADAAESATVSEAAQLEELLAQAEREMSPSRSFASLQAAMSRELAAFNSRSTIGAGLDIGAEAAGGAVDEAALHAWMEERGGDGGTGAAVGYAPRDAALWASQTGYWRCLADLRVRLASISTSEEGVGGRPSTGTIALTMPTYHAAQARAWEEAFCRHLAASGAAGGEVTVVPVTLPALPPTIVDAQRRLREGGARATGQGGDDGPGDTALSRWLPTKLQGALDDALRRLPDGYQRAERSAALNGYAAGGTAAAAAAASVVSGDGESSDGPHSVSSTFGPQSSAMSGGEPDAGDAPSTAVVIRKKAPPIRPAWYAEPDRLSQESAARVTAAAAAHDAEQQSRRAAHMIREVNRVFQERIPAATDIVRSKGGAVALAVPPPGLPTSDLLDSWMRL